MEGRPRRSVLYMPGSNERALQKAKAIPADALIFDLEDAVAPDAKLLAREQVCAAVKSGGYGGREIVIRVNALETPWGTEDLLAACEAEPDAILVPKVVHAGDIVSAAKILQGVHAAEKIRLWAMMETPMAILNARTIAATAVYAENRLCCLVMGTNDLIKESRARALHDRFAIVPWLAMTLVAARAYRLDIIDGVYNDFRDELGLREECERGRTLGMDGKTLIHPDQVWPCNEIFSPTREEVEWSRKVIDAFGHSENENKGVIVVEGRMVERLHLPWPSARSPSPRRSARGNGFASDASASAKLARRPRPSHNPRCYRGESMPKTKTKTRVFSGVQPTGNLHLGNYLGAITKFVALQAEHECLYCVVDLHAITVFQDPDQLKHNTREVTAAFIASGIDPGKHIVFNQSQVSGHAELAWIFNCVARLGWLNRMTQFKEKAGKDREAASAGLYVYPNLMAADILLYHATHVPVGEDQKQHLELARDIAQKFNSDFAKTIAREGYPGGFFPLPEPLITGPATRVMSLRDGTRKMSKSDESDMTRINLTDDADAIAKKIRKAKTDPEPLPSEAKGLEARPEADNLVGIYAGLAETSKEEVLREFGNATFSKFKEALAELAATRLTPIGEEMRRLMADPVEIDRILSEGAARAHAIADPILAKTKDIVGFIRG